ncbi:MAG: hypothetical protein ACAI38_13730 [Myxococcota bacterium]|nr:hypothetical protein [Myxococcota bacterium]
MTQPLEPIRGTVAAPAEPTATPQYGLLSVLSGQTAQAVRERPEVLELANQQLRYFIDTRFGAGASPTQDEVRARLSAEMSRYVPAMAGTPNLGTLRAALVQRLDVHPEANLLEMLAAAERRWPSRVQQAPPRNLVMPEASQGLRLDPPRPAETIPPRSVEEQSRAQAQAEAAARRQRNLADTIALWRSLPGDKNIYPVQKDEYRNHALAEITRIYGSRDAGLRAVAELDSTVAAEMDKWVRPPLPTVR